MSVLGVAMGLLFLLIAPPLCAFTPESGFYNLFSSDAKNGEGTGIAIEIQNDYMFAAGFVFRPEGTATYVTIEGQLQRSKRGTWVLSDNHGLATYTGGQCIGTTTHCPYRAPTVAFIGGFSIEFTAENEGRLEWGPDGDKASISLRRTCVGSICYDAPSSLVGGWDVIVERASNADALRFGADRLAIAQVSPGGDTRTITGCIAHQTTTLSDCSKPDDRETIQGTALRCFDTACFAAYRYQLAVERKDENGRKRILRLYTFTERGGGGPFGGTISGTVNFCPRGVDSVTACMATPGVRFVGYKSASVNDLRPGPIN